MERCGSGWRSETICALIQGKLGSTSSSRDDLQPNIRRIARRIATPNLPTSKVSCERPSSSDICLSAQTGCRKSGRVGLVTMQPIRWVGRACNDAGSSRGGRCCRGLLMGMASFKTQSRDCRLKTVQPARGCGRRWCVPTPRSRAGCGWSTESCAGSFSCAP